MTAHRRTVILIATLVALAAACAPAPPPAPVIPLGPDGLYDVPRARTTADVDACTLLTAEELDELFGQYAEALPQRNDPPVCSFVGLGATGPVHLFLDEAMADLLQPGGGIATTISGHPARLLSTDDTEGCYVDVVLAPEPEQPGLRVVYIGDPNCDLPRRVAELVVPRLPLRNSTPA